MSEDKKDKIARCVITRLEMDPITKTISLEARLAGTIKSGDSWEIKPAETTVKCVRVPVEDFVARVMSGWFWVRKIQDVLRKGSKADAVIALRTGYDWTQTVTTKAREQASAPIVATRAMNQMTREEFQEFMKQARAYEAELEGIPSEDE
jgi:hypothetical protein